MAPSSTVDQQPATQAVYHNAMLSSAEIARLWQSNIYYSMLKCVDQHFLNTLEDKDLRSPIEFALSIFDQRINRSADILRSEGYPPPAGFGDEDTKLEAPRLFTDLYLYFYNLNMSRIGVVLAATNLAHSFRDDIRDFYTESLDSTTKFLNLISLIMLEKGIMIKPPITNNTKISDVVEKQNFLRGFLGERRPLLAAEIDYLFFGIRNNLVGEALLTGFQRTASSKQVRSYMSRGAEISRKHVNIFSSALEKEKIPVPMHSGELITDSTVPPFSDRLMMQHVVVLAGTGIGNYATAMAASLRHDLSANYVRLMAEAANYAEDGTNIMIANGWLEEPPRLTDRQASEGIFH